MKKNLFIPAVALLLLSGCNYNEENFKGLDEMTQPENVINVDYTLTDADYGTVSDNKANQSIAKEAGVSKALGYIKTDLFLSEDISAATYLPAFLSAKYYTADEGSSVKVTYNLKENKSELLSAYSSVKVFQPSNDDYDAIYGATEFAPYLNEGTNSKLTTLLSNKYKDAKGGDVVFVDYKYATGTDNVLKAPLLWQNFEGMATGELSSFKDWLNKGNWFVSSKGGTQWKVTSYDENQYVQYSAFKTKGECVGWLISPPIAVGSTDNFSFDLKVGNWNADCLKIKVSTNFDGTNPENATWTDITGQFAIPQKPTSGYANSFVSAGVFSLSPYGGGNVCIAFQYVGNGANDQTTTYQIDNIMIGNTLPTGGGFSSVPTYAVKVYDAKNTKWNNQDKKVSVLAYSDYIAMGQTKAYFSADVLAANYIPTYLAKQVAYPLDEDTRIVMYRYYNGKEVKIYGDEYVYSSVAARWTLNSRVVQKTDQFVYTDDKWNFDPSTTVTLSTDKGDKATSAFYQVITDWVKANKGAEYVTSYGNNDYYYGGSAYNNNFDFRPSAWKAQNGAAYGSMSDDELKKLMQSRLPEAFVPGLEATYPNAEPVEGVNVIYTVNFSTYDGSATTLWTIKYEVTAKCKFTYVENSLAEVK